MNENPDAPISRWMFEQLKPWYVRPKKELQRISCCCTLCANGWLLVGWRGSAAGGSRLATPQTAFPGRNSPAALVPSFLVTAARC